MVNCIDMEINITKNLKGHSLLEELYKKLNFNNLTTEEQNAYSLIQKVCLYDLENEDNVEKHIKSFKPNEDQIDMLKQLVDEVDNIEVKARIYDALQVNKKNIYANCLNAHQNYSQLTEEGDLGENRAFFIRSIEVLRTLGKGQSDLAKREFYKINNLILASTEDKHWYSQNILIRELFYLSLSSNINFDFSDFSDFIKVSINKFEREADYRQMRLGFETLKIVDRGNHKEYHLQIGKSFEKEADEINQNENSIKFLACSSYEKSLAIYSELGDYTSEVNCVKQKLVDAKKKAMNQMVAFNNSIPSNYKILSIIDDVSFKSFEHAIFWLIDLISLPTKEYFEKMSIQYKESYYFLQHFGSEVLNSSGNKIGLSEDNNKLLFMDARFFRESITLNVIIPALQKVQEQYAISYEKVYWLLYGSKFIQKSRFDLFVYAIHQGFIGNFLVATHLLLPQIEDSLRFILQKEGIIPTKLLEEIQEEISLSNIIGKYNSDGKLKGIVTDDLIFDLQGLLNEPFGDNLRNEVAHGLCEVNKLNGAPSVYLWWLSLKLSLRIDYFIVKKAE